MRCGITFSPSVTPPFLLVLGRKALTWEILKLDVFPQRTMQPIASVKAPLPEAAVPQLSKSRKITSPAALSLPASDPFYLGRSSLAAGPAESVSKPVRQVGVRQPTRLLVYY